MTLDKRANRALLSASLRTIPNAFVDFPVDGDEATIDLAPYAGQWIFLLAIDANITFLRGVHADLSAGAMFLPEDALQEYYVEPAAEVPVTVLGSTTGTLRVLYDAQQ